MFRYLQRSPASPRGVLRRLSLFLGLLAAAGVLRPVFSLELTNENGLNFGELHLGFGPGTDHWPNHMFYARKLTKKELIRWKRC